MPDRALRVLYIDDDPDLARLVQRVMRRHGHTVEHAGDAEQGLARIAEGGIDLICLDHQLPTGTGLDVLAALSEMPDPPAVVYVTGSAEMSVAVSALKAGAYDYVSKSGTGEFLDLLLNALEQAAERWRLRRAKERVEVELREAKDRAELLLQEVNHRVANSLAMVSALVRLQANALDDPAAQAALTETQNRISAIAAVHRRMHISDDVRAVDVDAYLRDLIEEVAHSLASPGGRVKVVTSLEPLRVATDRAASIGVIAVELVTNALKYAYPGNLRGEVRVILEPIEGGGAQLVVEDDGVGPSAETKVKGTGLGTRLMGAMATSLGSSVDYRDAGKGTRAVLRIPA